MQWATCFLFLDRIKLANCVCVCSCQQKRELEASYCDELNELRSRLEELEQERHSLHYKLSESNRERQKLREQLSCVGAGSDASRRQYEEAVRQRDKLQGRVSEMGRENQLLMERLSKTQEAGGSGGSSATSDLRAQLEGLRRDREGLQCETEELSEMNNELRRDLEVARDRIRELEQESPVKPGERVGGRLSRGSSEELLVIKRSRSRPKFSQGSTDDDSDNLSSLTDLAALTSESSSGPGAQGLSGGGGTGSQGSSSIMVAPPPGPAPALGGGRTAVTSFEAKRKLSSSTSNLSSADPQEPRMPTHSRLNERNTRLQARLARCEKTMEEQKLANQELVVQVSAARKEREGASREGREAREQLSARSEELEQARAEVRKAKEEVAQVLKQKGVAMRENSASYEQTLKLQTEQKALQAEKDIVSEERDMAVKERDRIVMDNVQLKKSLDTLKAQRKKDGREFSMMKLMLEKARHSTEELGRRQAQDKAGRRQLEETLEEAHNALRRALGLKGSGGGGRGGTKSPPGGGGEGPGGADLSEDLREVLDRLSTSESERKVIVKHLFGPQEGSDGSTTLHDILHKVRECACMSCLSVQS